MKKFKKSLSVLLMLMLAFTFTFASTGSVYAAGTDKSTVSSLSAPKITSLTSDGKTITIKWSKVTGAEKYKLYKRANKTVWNYYKTVRKTQKNLKKYSDEAKYKLKAKRNKYKVYKKSTKKVWKLIKTQKSRTYKFKGKYNTSYRFAVKAVKGKTVSKYSKAKTIKTGKKSDEGERTGTVGQDEQDTRDVSAYIDYLTGKGESSGKNIRIAALDLYKNLSLSDVESGKNTMVSPLSFITAMGLLENGANGASLNEIEKAFGIKTKDLNKWYENWSGYSKAGGSEALKLANSVWIRNNDEHLIVNDSYLDKVKDIYDGDAYREPFDKGTVKKVNKWVNDKTDGMIPSIIDRLTEDNMMILMNATCFEGAWESEYQDSQVKTDEDFTREDGTEEKATMLYSTDSDGRFFETDKLTGTYKNYKGGYRIMFLLPKEGISTYEVLNGLKDDDIHQLGQNAERASVDLVIPEFSFDYTAPDSVKSLKTMGINSVFDGELADLSTMATRDDGYNLAVGEIVHKTHIELDREGTKAAAVTEIGIVKSSAFYPPPEKKTVRLDRPFIFVISDSLTDTPIFIGTVMSIQ